MALVAVDVSPEPQAVHSALDEWPGVVYHVGFSALHAWIRKHHPAYTPLLDGEYGGARNAGLLVASALGKPVIVLDEDVLPGDFETLNRFEQLLGDGYDYVQGRLAGRTLRFDRVRDHLATALKAPAPSLVLEALSGLDQPLPEPTRHPFPVPGCVALSVRAVGAQAFWPQAPVVDDALYRHVLARYLPDAKEFWDSQADARVPFGVRDPRPGSVASYLEQEKRWAHAHALTQGLQYVLEKDPKAARDPSTAFLLHAYHHVVSACVQAWFDQRARLDDLPPEAARHLTGQAREALAAVSRVSVADLTPTPGAFEHAAIAFLNVQRVWPHAQKHLRLQDWLSRWKTDGVIDEHHALKTA